MNTQTPQRIYDAVIVGAGPAGMAAAIALARMGLDAVCAGPSPDERTDRRTTALLQGSVGLLDSKLGVWERLARHAAPLKELRLIDRTGRLFRAPDVRFSAAEAGEECFGYNIPNRELSRELHAAIGPRFLPTAGVTGLEPEGGAMRIALKEGDVLRARLVVGADGRGSFCRESQRIQIRSWSYPQTAIVCNIEHTRPHGHACTEFHYPSGPLTLVPLPGQASSLVWVVRPERAAELAAMTEQAFLASLHARIGGLLGRLLTAGPRGAFPLSGLIARRLTGHRLALAGEAAHVMPPIGAQGLNLGFRDIADLARCLEGADDPGAPEVLNAYARRRAGDVWTRTLAADLLNRTLVSNLPLFQVARSAGLAALTMAGPLRRAAMRRGMSAMSQ